MRLSCVLLVNLALVGGGAVSAAALDAAHSVRHTRTPHLIEPHHARHAAHSAVKGTSKTAATHAQATAGPGSRKLGSGAATIRRTRLSIRHHYYERFTASSFAAGNIFADDLAVGEDPIVRQAAIDALGDMNGTAVVINPANGRILAMVNQKLALSPGAEPAPLSRSPLPWLPSPRAS